MAGNVANELVKKFVKKKEDVMARSATKRTGGSRRTETGKRESAPAPAPPQAPCHEEIARRAYEIYLERAGREGSAFEDWVEAERQLMQRSA